MPSGTVETVNGVGPFRLDPQEAQAVIAASLASSPDGKLVIDLNHSTDLAAPQGQPAPAQGWIEGLEARADGIWGRVSWTEAGRSALMDRAYRFISPVVRHARSTGKVVALLRASLTNNPNIHRLQPVLNHATPEDDMNLLKALNAALGLAEAGTEADALAAVTALKTGTALNTALLAKVAKAAKLAETADEATILNAVTALADPAQTVPAASFAEVQTALNAATTRLATLEQDGKRARAEAFVDGAIKQGRAGVKPSRDYFISLHMADAKQCETMVAGFPVMTGEMAFAAPAEAGAVSLNAADTTVARLLGLKPDDMAKTRKSLEENRT